MNAPTKLDVLCKCAKIVHFAKILNKCLTFFGETCCEESSMEKKKIFHTSYHMVCSHYKNVHTLPISTILKNHPTRKYNKAL